MAVIHCLGGFLKKTTLFCLLVCVPFPVPSSQIQFLPQFLLRLSGPGGLSSGLPSVQMSAGDLPKDSEVIHHHQPPRGSSGDRLDLQACQRRTHLEVPLTPSTSAAFHAVLWPVYLLPPHLGHKSSNVQGQAEAFGS